MTMSYPVQNMTDDQLVGQLQRLVARDSQHTAELLAYLGEVDTRKLYLERAYSSMFTFCVDVLHLSEAAAYKRIHAARLARRFPKILEMIAAGQLHLTATKLIGGYLTSDNHEELLQLVVHKSKRQIEQLFADRFPKPDVPSVVRKLPARPRGEPMAQQAPVAAPTGSGASSPRPALIMSVAPPSQPAVAAPLAPDRYKIQFTASKRLHDKFRQAQELLRHRLL